MTADILISPDGLTVHAIYCDDHRELYRELGDGRPLGAVTRRRMSHVEPDDASGGWTADMAPAAGPVLGPFDSREQALAEEVAWLKEHRNL